MAELEGILANAFEDLVEARFEGNDKIRLNRGPLCRVLIDGRNGLTHPKRFPRDLFIEALYHHCGIGSCAAAVIYSYGLKGISKPLVRYNGSILTGGSAYKLRQAETAFKEPQ